MSLKNQLGKIKRVEGDSSETGEGAVSNPLKKKDSRLVDEKKKPRHLMFTDTEYKKIKSDAVYHGMTISKYLNSAAEHYDAEKRKK
jgi:hypothetical protein